MTCRLLAFLLAVSALACAQGLPDAPQPHARQFWAVHAVWYATIVADGAVSARSSNRNCQEVNFMYRNAGGGFSAGKYWVVNLPAAAAITLLDRRLAKKWRWAAIIAPAVLGYSHASQAATWRGC